MTKIEKLNKIKECGIIAIIRAKSSVQLFEAVGAIKKGGVTVIEVTMTTPGVFSVINQAKLKYGDEVLFGIGSVLDSETARMAILEGADFIVSPNLDTQTIALCNRYSIPHIPGCFTPTEMVKALESGVSMVKLFPASLGGPDLVEALLAPLPNLEIVPVGGITLENAENFIEKGAVALGVGSSLINQKLLDTGNLTEITIRAETFIEKVKKGREMQ